VPYCGSNLPAIAGTSDFQDALAGLQQLQLLTAAFAFGGSYGPGGNVLINQVPSVTPDLLTAAFASIDGAIALPAPVPVNQFATSNLPAMVTAREYHTATLLANGKVLIAGGEDNSVNILNTAELYDPAANAFTAVSSTMSFARESATATLLPNGKVLIAGGLGEGGDVSAAEIYDPVANSFSVGPTMVYPRDSASAILLPNGKVLIAGGFSDGAVQSTAELLRSGEQFLYRRAARNDRGALSPDYHAAHQRPGVDHGRFQCQRHPQQHRHLQSVDKLVLRRFRR
jgi:hypothetical protein